MDANCATTFTPGPPPITPAPTPPTPTATPPTSTPTACTGCCPPSFSHNVSVPVLAGWTWIAVPKTQMIGDLDFPEITAGDLVKSQTQYTQYYEDHGWFGSLTELKLGVGYKLKASKGGKVKF